MGRQIEELAQFVARVRCEDIPEPVRAHARLVLLDTLGVILAGGERPEVAALRERLGEGAGTGATVYARGWPSNDPRTAALLNGVAGRAIELCEGLRLVSGQAAMQVLPAVLAVGEQAGSTGREMLAAFILGYDVVGRLAARFTPRPLAHQNGQVALLAAAAAGAKLRGLDAAGVSRAMRIATTLLLTPSYTNAVAGATALNVAGGMSGYAGALAPDLALAGFEAQPDAIEEALGQLVGAGFVPDGMLDELGTTWEITRNYFRLYACCNPIHPALDCLAAALAELRAGPGAGRADRGRDLPLCVGDAQPGPAELFRFEILAAACRGGDGRTRRRRVRRTRRQRVARPGHRGAAPAGPDQRRPGDDALAPRLRPARVTVTLTDGRRATHARDSHRGDFNEPFAECGNPRQVPRIGRHRADRGRRGRGRARRRSHRGLGRNVRIDRRCCAASGRG